MMKKRIPTLQGALIIIVATIIIIPSSYFLIEKIQSDDTARKEKIEKEHDLEKTVINIEKDTVSETILEYLNKYPEKAEEILGNLFFEISEDETKKVIQSIKKADLTGNNSEELAIVFFSDHQTLQGTPSAFAVYSKENGSYEISFEKDLGLHDDYFSYFIRDINNDGTPNVVLVTSQCGAHTCQSFVNVIQYHKEEWHNLTPNMYMPSSEVEFKDYSNDGKEEIILTGGGIVSVGAGMQRSRTEIYAYRDGEYDLLKKEKEEPFNIYYLMLDAHENIAEEKMIDALMLTTKALQNPDFGVNETISERDQSRILAYTGIQLMMIYLERTPPDIGPAKIVLGEITKKYHKHNNPYIDAAHVLIDTYDITGNLMEACQAMEEVIIQAGSEAYFLEQRGYATEKIPKEEICPW